MSEADKKFLHLLMVIGIVILTVQIYFVSQASQTESTTKFDPTACLSEGEEALYEIPDRFATNGKINIFVRNIETKEIIKNLTLDIPRPNHYHPVDLRPCGIYLFKYFNYDPKLERQVEGYREELWKYDYEGNGKKLILLAEKNPEFVSFFSPNFSTDPTESYITLEKSYLGQDDYALVIKSLDTLEDVFTLKMRDVMRDHPTIRGSFGLGLWEYLDNELYLYGEIFDGNYTTAVYRIRPRDWRVEIWETPKNYIGGGEVRFSVDGMIAYGDMIVWTGIYEVDEQIMSEAEKEGKKLNLYVADLKTGVTQKIDSASPRHLFRLKWLSPHTLQYINSSGATTTYTVVE